MLLEPLPEIRRLVYGGLGLLLGVAITRVAGFHVVVHHLTAGHPISGDPLWLGAFVVGIVVSLAPPLWYWLLRPPLAQRSARARSEEVAK